MPSQRATNGMQEGSVLLFLLLLFYFFSSYYSSASSPPPPPPLPSCTGTTVHSSITALTWTQSCNFHLRLPITNIFRSSTASRPNRSAYLSNALWFIKCYLLQGSCSCILQRCLSHISLPPLLTVTISGR